MKSQNIETISASHSILANKARYQQSKHVPKSSVSINWFYRFIKLKHFPAASHLHPQQFSMLSLYAAWKMPP